MALTCTGCSVTVPTLSASCGQSTKPGGIVAIGIVACDYVFTNPTDGAEWTTAIGANDARVIKNLLGSMPDPSNTSKRIASCSAEQLTGKTWTINLLDHNFIETGSPLVYEKEAFYNDIQNNPSQYYLFYGTCDGRMYRVEDFTLMMNVNIPDNSQELRFMNVQINFIGKTQGTQFVFDLRTV